MQSLQDARILSYGEISDRFDLESLLPGEEPWFLEDEDVRVTLFEGDTRWDRDINPDFLIETSENATFSRIVIVEGNLTCTGQLNLSYMDALVVLGDLECEVFQTSECLCYVEGNLTARLGLIAQAEDDETNGDWVGEGHLAVGGEVRSPNAHTWYYRLSHLDLAPGVEEDIADDQPGHEAGIDPSELIGQWQAD